MLSCEEQLEYAINGCTDWVVRVLEEDRVETHCQFLRESGEGGSPAVLDEHPRYFQEIRVVRHAFESAGDLVTYDTLW